MYPTVTLLVTKSSTFFFMIGFSVLFQECSNHIWNCPLPTVDQKLSNSNQGQETQLEEYVLRIHINDESQQKLFIAKRELVSHFKTISEHLCPPCTSLQLSHPKYEFWAAKNVTCLPLPFLFPGHNNKNHSAQTWGLGCFFLDYSQPG